MEIRKIDFEIEPRLESGPVQFGNDWPGVFLRGDHCAYYALCLEQLDDQLDSAEDVVAALAIKNLLEMFQSSNLNLSK